MNYEKILFTGICGAITLMGLDTIIQGKGFHNYVAAIIGLILGLTLGYLQKGKQ
jgi:hypothetical protein